MHVVPGLIICKGMIQTWNLIQSINYEQMGRSIRYFLIKLLNSWQSLLIMVSFFKKQLHDQQIRHPSSLHCSFFFITYKCPFTNNTPKWIKVWIPKWRFVPTDIVPSVYKGPCFKSIPQGHNTGHNRRTEGRRTAISFPSWMPDCGVHLVTEWINTIYSFSLFYLSLSLFFFFTVILASIETYQVHFQELELELTHQGKWVLEVDEKNSHVDIPFKRQAWSMNSHVKKINSNAF